MLKKFLLIIITMLLMSFVSFAADTTNAAVYWHETPTSITYYGTLKFGKAGGTDNVTSKAMYIAGCNRYFGEVAVYISDISGTEDANGIMLYADEDTTALTNFHGTTYAELDAIGTTLKADTLGTEQHASDGFRSGVWMILKLDGQTGNPNAAEANFRITVFKSPGMPATGVAGVKSST